MAHVSRLAIRIGLDGLHSLLARHNRTARGISGIGPALASRVVAMLIVRLLSQFALPHCRLNPKECPIHLARPTVHSWCSTVRLAAAAA
jgi:hypothetical protein